MLLIASVCLCVFLRHHRVLPVDILLFVSLFTFIIVMYLFLFCIRYGMHYNARAYILTRQNKAISCLYEEKVSNDRVRI